ncbi:hypothetical protein O988_04787 [Pseudogymnoascus sp. VKM F-3808]|nr:hypothetical protein O988_04787 [Pseudogymnoascus sp. VKM F-3808]
MLSRQAAQACLPCRKLKRKCTRELPACSMCARLSKSCAYPPKVHSVDDNNGSSVLQLGGGSQQRLEPGLTLGIRHGIEGLSRSEIAGQTPELASRESNLATNSKPEAGLPKISEVPPEGDRPASSALYSLAKEQYHRVESDCLISLQLVQSAILIAVYEIGHGIYPAGYLSIGQAARLGIMIGLHDRKNAAQLFKGPETLSQCEEELRVWWAIIILDRYVNVGVSGLPLATPEPRQGALLPCAESNWNRGEFGSNQPLFVSSFGNNTEVGSFAKTCQASHVLGLILRHRDDRSNNSIDGQFRLSEAKQLHLTLVALNRHLAQNIHAFVDGSSTDIAAALCYSARIILYEMYACNEHYGQPRLSDEAWMQQASMEGLKEVTRSVYQLAQKILDVAVVTDSLLLSKSLLVCHCLYQASSECAWFIREDKTIEEVACLEAMVMLLRAIGKKWHIAKEYIKGLDAEGDLASIKK